MRLKKAVILVLGAVLSVALTGCDKGGKVNLDNDKGKYSYAIGQQVGTNIKSQKLDVDQASLVAGLKDALGGKTPKMDEKESMAALQKMSELQRASQAKEGEANIKKGQEYLEANKGKEGVKVTDSGLQYKVLKEGKGQKPKASGRVKVHYKGTLTDGTEFDSSHKRGRPAEFDVGAVIKGWTEGLQLMTEGSTYEFYIPSDLAYGSQPRPTIPANSVLVFKVELIQVLK